MKELSVYVHIPFCDHKCIYCDFYSITRHDDIEKYLLALKREIEFYAHNFSQNNLIKTIYFGGGTPSLMKPCYIGDILRCITEYFTVEANAEISLEANPGTVNKEKLKAFKSEGINRLSIGVQSFDDGELKFLTRIHDKETAIKTILEAETAGFENINLDLIFALPNQTKAGWLKNLKIAAGLPVKHISAYSLILEKGTILNKLVLEGKVKLHSHDFDADLYEYTIDFLNKKNFHQYEVSNFAKEGFECKHNLAYWEHKEYLGFGASAHSFYGNTRWWNYSALNFYLQQMNRENHGLVHREILNERILLDEYVMLALRSKGLDIEILQKKYGNAWIRNNHEYLFKLRDDGFVKVSNNFVKFTKKGFSLCDEILSNFK